jgi:DNA-binding response OmpR family regulator
VSPTAQLRPVSTTQGDRYAVAAIVVQESTGDTVGASTTELTELATRLADEARRLLLEERPGATVTAAVAVSTDRATAAPVILDADRPILAADRTDRTDRTTPAGPVGGIEVDRHAYQARVEGHVLGLSFREFELLAFLAENPGRVFSRRQLVSSVWDGAAVGARTVDVHVRRLRMKLGAHADRITTVRNVGYRFEPGQADLETVA